MKITKSLLGPFDFFGQNPENLFINQSNNDSPGIYFWAIKCESEYLINYVGMAKHSIRRRSLQHIGNFYGLQYNIYSLQVLRNPELLLQNQDNHHDSYYEFSGKDTFKVEKREAFVHSYFNDFKAASDLIQSQYEFIKLFYVPLTYYDLLIPLDLEKEEACRLFARRLRYIEAKLIRDLSRSDDKLVKLILDNGLRGVLKMENPNIEQYKCRLTIHCREYNFRGIRDNKIEIE